MNVRDLLDTRDDETELRELGTEVPAWVDQDITARDCEAIEQGGCASGAYMPAVTYYQARNTMSEHGDAIWQYLEDTLGEVPAADLSKVTSWDDLACFYVSAAVELWASSVLEEELDEDEVEDEIATA